MAVPAESQRSFRLYVTHVDGDCHFLKISGQLDQQSSLMVETLFVSARENLEKGIGAVPPSAIHEGIICAAKYKDGTYYRAKIINTTNLSSGLVGVHFIDYGNKDIISVSAIRFLDKYDPMFLQLRGQATDYYLSRIIHPSGRWDEPLLLKLQSLLCYVEYPAAIEGQTRTLPIISIQYKGNDFSTHLISNRFGIAVPVAKQEVLMLQPIGSDGQQGLNWMPNLIPDTPLYAEHVPFLVNQNFPSNPASAMRLQQNATVPFNGAIVPPSSAISQRLLVNQAKGTRGPVNLKGPIRQPQVALNSSPVHTATPPPAAPLNKSLSPKKSTTYKSRLLETNTQHKVFVSFAEEGPELFAVQLVTDAKKLQDMMDEINRRPHSSLAEPPMIGTVCLGRMSGDRIICRAIVMNLSGSQCKLFFVDFGDTEMVSYYDIFDIPEEFVKPNVFAMRFCLSGVKKLEKGPFLNEAFKQLVNGKVMTLRVVAPEGPPLIQYGELYLDGKNVLDLLLANVKDKLQFKWMEMLALGSRSSVLVSYVDSCIKFYAQLSDKIDELTAVMEAVKVHCENTSSPGELPVGAACCARFPDDGKWYRARVLGTNNKRITVSYVDYGNEQEVDVSDLRTITPDLIKLPAQAMKCALKGFENKPVESKTSNQLEMLALEKTLIANIVGVLSSDTMLVSLVDDTVSPPLDVARKMNQLSQPRGAETKPTTPVSKAAPEQFSSPESAAEEQWHGKGFKREKSFREERRPREESDSVVGQRGGSFRNRENREPFDRSGPGRHSDKFGGRPDKGERRGGKPWESNAPAASADEWEEPAAPARPTYRDNNTRDNRRKLRTEQHEKPNQKPGWKHKDSSGVGKRLKQAAEAASADAQKAHKGSIQDRLKRDKFNKQDEWEEKKPDDRFGAARENRFDRQNRENRGDRPNWSDKKDWGQKRDFRDNRAERDGGERGDRTKSNFNPRERAERSFGSDTDKRSERSFGSQGRAPPYKPRGKFTQVQYKELSDPVPLETQFQEPTVESEAQHEVSVTWIVSPKSFFVQILSLQPKFLDMMHKIPELYKGVKSYTGSVPLGASVLARYPADGVLYRATVVSVQPFSKFIVQYVDFGNKQVVDAKDIWQLDQQLMELPKMAIHCCLIGVAPMDGEWKAKPEIDLCFNAPRYQCVFQECTEGQYQVSLWNNGASVVDMLVEKQLAMLSEQQFSVTLKDEAIDLTIIVGQQIPCRVTHFVGYDKFYVQLDLEKAQLVEDAIANFDVNLLTPLSADSLMDGVHCTVKHDGKIYRAILNDTSDANNVSAVLPDYGITITTSLVNLMILPTELSVYYYQSLECCLHNYTAESTALIPAEELKTKLTGNKFIVYIDSVEDIKLVTTLYDIATGQKLCIFEPDDGAFEEVTPLCARTVFNYNFGLASIQHLENLNEIYMQKIADIDKVQALLDKLYVFYDEGTPTPLTEFEPESLCAAKSSDGNWYRATIVSATETDVKLQFPDYGNMETIAKDMVKKLDPSFYEPCAQALVTSLGLVALNADAVSKLSEWTTDKEVQVTLAFGADGWLASLHLDGVDLSMKLVNEKLATPQVATSEEPAPAAEPTAETVEPVSLPAGCTQVYISHIDTPGHFWLQMADKIDKIEEIQAQLKNDADKYEDLQAREMGTLCAAKYSVDDLWYRAEVLDLDSDITTVRFIDYGNTDVLDNQPGLVKVMPEQLRAIEPLAVRSSVNAVPTGTGQWSEPAADSFVELIGDTAEPVDALIVLKDVTTYVDLFVAGRNVTDQLVAQGHATRSEQQECGALPSCYASHVNSPSEFWVQLESATTELQAVEAAMEDAENLPELASREEGVLCAAKYPEDGAWYRAQVIVDGSEGTEVLFMDYGNASIATELRSLPDELKVKPALSRKCALQKPRDIKSWSRKSELKFNEMAAEGRTIFNVQFIASGDISIVELFLDGKSVTEELVGLCEEQLPSERPTPVGQDLRSTGKLCYVHTVDEFYVHLDDKTTDLDKVTEAMGDAAEYESAPELKVGSICAAFWAEDEQWYRGKILEFCDASYHVQFLDYGNKAKCDEFRQLPEELASIEPLAKCCRLATPDGAANDEARNKLDELMANDSTFHIEFLDSTTEPALVKLILDGDDVSNILFPSKSKETMKSEVVPEIAVLESIKVPHEEIDTTKPDVSTTQPSETEKTVETISEPQCTTNNIESMEEVNSSKEVEHPKEIAQEVESPKEVTQEEESPKKVTQEEESPKEEPQDESPKRVEQEEESPKEVAQEESPKRVEQEVESPKEVAQELEYPKEVAQEVESQKEITQKVGCPEEPNKEKEIESVLLIDNEKQADKEIEDEDKFEDANELDSSHPELDESLESNHTVIENKSFEANPDSFNDEDKEQLDSPKRDTSSETLESSNGTIKTPERDDSKDSINTDTGYTSSDGTKDGSPVKEPSGPVRLKESGDDKVEIETKVELKTETKDTIALNDKSNDSKVDTEVKAVD